MPIIDEIVHSLFGEPMVVEVSPSADGRRVFVTERVNSTTVLALVISAILFAIYLWFYISPILRDKNVVAPFSQTKRNAREETTYETEKNTLLAWMRRGSRGRFADTEGNRRAPQIKDNERFSFFRPRAPLFARSSIIPPVTEITPPPPAYVSHPNSPTSEYRFPSPPKTPTPLRSTGGVRMVAAHQNLSVPETSNRASLSTTTRPPLNHMFLSDPAPAFTRDENLTGQFLRPFQSLRPHENTLDPPLLPFPVLSRTVVHDREVSSASRRSHRANHSDGFLCTPSKTMSPYISPHF